jgi:UDP-GlcNAc:undecaprenyl-phosphate GlcNAc-1-phosphate transferase
MDSLKGSPLVAFIAALLVALIATPAARVLALRCDAVAKPDARKIHEGAMPQWGGLAIFLAVAFAALLWRQPNTDDLRQLAASSTPSDLQAVKQNVHLSAAFFGCGFLMLLLGMADDRLELKPVWKFLGQIFIVILLWCLGVKIQTLPFTSGTQPLSDSMSMLLTMVWVLGLVNAMNFIDGVDGLAAGIAAIGAASMAFIEVGKAPWAAAVAASIAGSCVGFLRYNFPPAKIFLGDAGSLLIGFWLATVSLAAASKTAAATTLLLPMLVLGVPLFDVLWAILRRAWAGKPIWRADRGHLHHRLLARGFTARKVLLVLYSVSIALGAMAVAITKLRG